ncbi:MAG: hypothetical protein GF311_04310 [Candidatus Lokiarchaeota archaeon]|nr:hypothetical protein [Candidatus Lokiarchaeota archaeon]
MDYYAVNLLYRKEDFIPVIRYLNSHFSMVYTLDFTEEFLEDWMDTFFELKLADLKNPLFSSFVNNIFTLQEHGFDDSLIRDIFNIYITRAIKQEKSKSLLHFILEKLERIHILYAVDLLETILDGITENGKYDLCDDHFISESKNLFDNDHQ